MLAGSLTLLFAWGTASDEVKKASLLELPVPS